MKSSNVSATVLMVAAIVISLAVLGGGTWVYAQNATSNAPPGENAGSKDSRSGSATKGQPSTTSPEKASTVQQNTRPSAPPIDKGVGGTIRGLPPRP
jgi:hypothetical protein